MSQLQQSMKFCFDSGVLEVSSDNAGLLSGFSDDPDSWDLDTDEAVYAGFYASQEAVNEFLKMAAMDTGALSCYVSCSMDLRFAFEIVKIADYFSCNAVVNELCCAFEVETRLLSGTLVVDDPSAVSTGQFEVTVNWKENFSCCEVNVIVALPDARVAFGCCDGSVTLRGVLGPRESVTLHGHPSDVTALLVLPGGNLVSAYKDGLIHIWDTDTEEIVATLKGHVNAVTSLTCGARDLLVSACVGGWLLFWNVITGACLASVEAHKKSINMLATLPDGCIASASDDSTVSFWDPVTFSRLQTATFGGVSVKTLSVLHDGMIACGLQDGLLCLLQAETMHLIHDCEMNAVPLMVLPDGKLVVAQGSRTLASLDLHSYRQRTSVIDHSQRIVGLVRLPGVRFLCVSSDGTCSLLGALTSRESREDVLREGGLDIKMIERCLSGSD